MPNNAGYYHLAYAVATGIYAVYAITLAVRWNRVKGMHQNGDDK